MDSGGGWWRNSCSTTSHQPSARSERAALDLIGMGPSTVAAQPLIGRVLANVAALALFGGVLQSVLRARRLLVGGLACLGCSGGGRLAGPYGRSGFSHAETGTLHRRRGSCGGLQRYGLSRRLTAMTKLEAPEVAEPLVEIGGRAALAGGNPYKAKACLRAAESLRGLARPLAEVIGRRELRQIPGVGPAIAERIARLHETGSDPALDRMRAKLPAGVVDMLAIPGLR